MRMSMDGQGTKCRRNIAENYNRLSRVHEQTDSRHLCVNLISLKLIKISKSALAWQEDAAKHSHFGRPTTGWLPRTAVCAVVCV